MSRRKSGRKNRRKHLNKKRATDVVGGVQYGVKLCGGRLTMKEDAFKFFFPYFYQMTQKAVVIQELLRLTPPGCRLQTG